MRNATAWLHDFRANNLHLLEVPWHIAQALTLAERRAIACPCGHQARYRELRSRRLFTALGEVAPLVSVSALS